MTALQRRCRTAIEQWCRAQKKPAAAVRHLYTRGYVVARPAPACLVVSVPAVEAEAHLETWIGRFGAVIVHEFDPELQVGDWCTTAYVVRSTSGENVAIPVVP